MNRRKPLYAMVYERLRSHLEDGVYQEGDQLPAEAELAKDLGVSLITVRRALQELADEGWLSRQPGRGTFVTRPARIDQPVAALTSFTSDMLALGIIPSSDVLRQEVVAATAQIARNLSIAEGEPVFRLQRVRKGNGVPLLLEDVCVPLGVCPELAEVDFRVQSLYKVLTDHGISLTKSEQEFEPVVLTDEQARLLQVPGGSPAFLRRAVSYQEHRLVEWVQSIYRKDRFRFVVETGQYSPKFLYISDKESSSKKSS
ncbi:MAG: GntR family transcriptional regulator [Alicyclobacillus sp.]|nr:GntR family transcriptional regulator [Alicyclobacillus sp.]